MKSKNAGRVLGLVVAVCALLGERGVAVRSACANDVGGIALFKQEQFVEVALGAPTDGGPTISFGCFVSGTKPNVITNVSVTGPATLPMRNVSVGQSWEGVVSYPTLTELDANYPDGLYHITVDTVNNGTETFDLNFVGDPFAGGTQFPSPHVTSWSLDSNNNVTVTWDPVPGIGPGDRYSLTSFGPSSSWPVGWVSVNGLTTSAVIPANGGYPGAGVPFKITLDAQHFACNDTTSYPGVQVTAVYDSQTQFQFASNRMPEPTSFALFGIGVFGLLLRGRKR